MADNLTSTSTTERISMGNNDIYPQCELDGVNIVDPKRILVIGLPRTGKSDKLLNAYPKPSSILSRDPGKMSVTDPSGDYLESVAAKVLITYEDLDGYQCDVLLVMPCNKDANDDVVDEAVSDWVKAYLPSVHWYEWQRASDCGLENVPAAWDFDK